MNTRARAVVFWLNTINDIEELLLKCSPCHKKAPSQAMIPPTRVPTVPFEMTYAEYFKLEGVNDLIVGGYRARLKYLVTKGKIVLLAQRDHVKP